VSRIKGRKNISLLEGQPGGDAQCFLTAPEENSPEDFAHPVKAGQFFIQKARQHCQPVSLDELIA
jgi:hypothetical protein